MVDFETVEEFIKEKLKSENYRLKRAEEVALEAAWERITYEKASAESGVNLNTLQGSVAPALWNKLSKIYSRRITKANFKEIFTEIISQERTNVLVTEQPQPDVADVEIADTHSPASRIPIVGAALPVVEPFCGRQRELKELGVLLNRYSCLLVVGPEGIGKKSLVSRFLQDAALPYSQIIWKPLHHRPVHLEAELLQLLNIEANSSLISYLKVQKSLIVFESIDSMITRQSGLSVLDPAVTSLIRRIAEETESKVIGLSSEPIEQIRSMMLRGNAMIYPLGGLGLPEAESLMGGDMNGHLEEVWESTGGNPLMLNRIKDWRRSHASSLSPTMAYRPTVHRGLFDGLHNQFFNGQALSTIDRTVLRSIANREEGIPFSELLSLHPGAAPNIQRLTEMGVVVEAESGPEALVKVYEFFRQYILEKESAFSRV